MAVDATPVSCTKGLKKTMKSEGNTTQIAAFLVWTETRRQTRGKYVLLCTI
jgi:hypothetical protein